MKTIAERVRGRLKRDRKMVTISIRMPEDVIEDLKEIAPLLGYSGYQPLMRGYIGQGLRVDLEKLEKSQMHLLTKSLRKSGVDEKTIAKAIAEANLKSA